MRFIFQIGIYISTLLLVACGTNGPATQRCLDTTPAMSGARWSCLSNAREIDNNQARVNQLQSKCDSYGFQRGTTAYSQCLMNIEQQNNQAAYQQSIQQQQQLKNGAELLRGDGRAPGSSNCYRTPGVPNSAYCL